MLIDVSLTWIVVVLLVSARLAIIFFATPLDAFGRVPAQVKLLISLALAVALVSALSLDTKVLPNNIAGLGIAIINEVFVGLVMAFGLYCAFGAMMLGGRLLDFQAGFGAANVLNPATNTHSPLLGTVLTMMLTAVFFVSDAYLYVIRGLAFSLRQVPPGVGINSLSMELIMKQFGIVFSYGLILAAPVIAALALVDTAIGVMSRSMPQMNVYFLFLPLKIFIALLLVGMSLHYISPLIEQLFLNVFRYWQEAL